MLEETGLCISTTIALQVLQDWYSTDHGSHTPPQDDGNRADDGSGDGAADPM